MVQQRGKNSKYVPGTPRYANNNDTKRKISNWEAYIQLVKGNVGPGCLALPYAFSHGGVVESCVVFGVVIFITMFGMFALLDTKRMIRAGPRAISTPQTYGDVAFEMLGASGKRIVDLLLVMLQGGICAVQIDFVSTTLASIMPGVSQRVITFGSLPIFLALSCILSLKKLTPLVLMATVAMTAAIVTVIYMATDQIATFGTQINGVPNWELGNLPVLFGAILYAFEGITLVLPVERSMAEPERCHSVLFGAMSTVAVVYFAVAMLCFLAFGVINSGSVTVELEKRYGGEVVFGINVLLILATVLAYPLQLVPIAEVLEDHLDARPKDYTLIGQMQEGNLGQASNDSINTQERRLFRMGITVICGAIAVVCSDQLGLAMAIVGSLAGAGLGLVLPSMMNLAGSVTGSSYGCFYQILNLVVLLLGLTGAAIGTGVSVTEMVQNMEGGGRGGL